MGLRTTSFREGVVFSPLTARKSRQRRINFCTAEKKVETPTTTETTSTTTESQLSFVVYVGENFSVQLPRSLNLVHLVNDTMTNGMVTTSFFGHQTQSVGTIRLTAGGHKMLSVPNAGGSSVVSEVLSFELLGRCFGAKLTKTEMEVSYFPKGGSITDYVCEVFQVTLGVSVTRAWKYHGDYSLEDAEHILRKKLKGVNQSSKNSLVKWSKQILHVWSASQHVTDLLQQAYENLDTEVKANTIVLITTAPEAHYIFSNG